MERLDCVVVGAGVVGLAVSRRLARSGRSVLAIERHNRYGLETSSRNSEVIHSGLYYPANSLKARFCLEGNRELYELCERRGIFARRTGKLIVAVESSQIPALEELRRRAESNGVSGVQILDGPTVSTRAPAVRALGGLWIPSTGIIDTEGLMTFLHSEAETAGAMFLWSTSLTRVEKASDGYRLWFSTGESAHARCVVNCAGLHADKVARLAGVDSYSLHWFKGEYFSLRRPLAVETLVYPVPEKHGLGVHLTLDARGGQRLGPNAFPVTEIDYSIDASHADAFWEGARRYLPALRREDLMPGTVGIRPKLSPDGSFRDFIVAEESARGLPGWINLVGIESPGLTSCLPIADHVAGLAAAG